VGTWRPARVSPQQRYYYFSYYAATYTCPLSWEQILSEEAAPEHKLFQSTAFWRGFLKISFVQQMNQIKVAQIPHKWFFLA